MKNLFLAALGVLLSLAVSGRAADYTVDPVHSSFLFRVGHLGVGAVHGRFDAASGTVSYDPADPARTVLRFEVRTESVDTGSAERDAHLKGPEFFDTAQFPTATFVSRSVEAVDAKTFRVTGDFTLHGVTRSLTVPVTFGGLGKGMKGEPRLGGEAAFAIERSDYGMKAFLPAVGDTVTLTVEVEAVGK